MTPLSEEQKKKMGDRAAKAEKIANGTSGEAPTGEPVPLSVILGEGKSVLIGNCAYELAPFPLGKLAQASRLVDACPEMLLAAALSGEDGTTSVSQVADTMNRLAKMASGEESETLTPDMIEQTFAMLAFNVSDEQAAAMVDLTVLALSRRYPELTREDIEDEIDLETFLTVLILILEKNKSLKKRF